MRARLLVAGLVAGAAVSVVPLAPASAYCEPEIIVVEGQQQGCRNSCMETGERYEKARRVVEDKTGVVALPGYWDLFACPM